jgi:protein-disulfide isomerase
MRQKLREKDHRAEQHPANDLARSWRPRAPDLLWVARGIEFDEEETNTALRERRFRGRVLADAAGGRRAGVHATPTFFVDGERLDGPWRQLANMVPAKLEKASL